MADQLRDLLRIIRESPPRVAVVGDAVLDRWVGGPVRRLSREAPVPVVTSVDSRECAGGAGNTAVNLAALGAHVRLVSVVGDDAEGAALLRVLGDAGVDVSGVVVRAGARTPSKTRVVGADQILVRVDTEPVEPLGAGVVPEMREFLAGAPDDALVVCDYGTGVLDDDAADWIADLPRPRLVLVDAHDVGRWRALHPDVVTPNAAETGRLLGRDLVGDRAADAVRSADALLAASGATVLAATMDRDGAVVLTRDGVIARTSARPSPESRASGAGDTFAAALAVAVCAGAPLPLAAELAQRAADVVVGRAGTAVCSLADLDPTASDDSAEDSAAVLARIRADRTGGRRLVFTNGCFDLLHHGHVLHLRQAKALGDVLVVAVNDDASVRRLKGDGRPLTPLAERAALLSALDCVDHVIAFGEDSPVGLLRELRPDVYTKGGDYTPEMLTETATVRACGGEVRILDYLPDHSTTRVVERIRATGTRVAGGASGS